MTDGLPKGELVVIASRPGMGKSAFVMKIAEHVVCNLDRAALVNSNSLRSSKDSEHWPKNSTSR